MSRVFNVAPPGGKNTGWQNRNTCFNNSNVQYYHWLNFQVLFSWSSPSSLVRWSCWNLCTSCLFCQILISGSFFTRPSVRSASMISERQERQHQLCFYQMSESFSFTTEWLPMVTVEKKIIIIIILLLLFYYYYFLDFIVCNKGENFLFCEWKGLNLASWDVEFTFSKKYEKNNLIHFDFFHDTSMTHSLVKCVIHHAALVCCLQKALHLFCSPSIWLPAHVSLSEAAKWWMTDCQLRCVVEGGPAKTDPCTAQGKAVHVSQSSAWPCGSSRCFAANTERSEWDPLNAVVGK